MANLVINPTQKIIISVILAVGMVILFPGAHKSLRAKNKKLIEQINESKAEINKASALDSAQETLNSEINQLTGNLGVVEQNFFLRPEDIFTNLNRAAIESQVSIKGIAPLERIRKEIPERKDLHLELLPLNIKIKCDFFQLLTFLKKIGQTENLMPIDTILIKGDPKDVWNHDVEILLKIPLLITS